MFVTGTRNRVFLRHNSLLLLLSLQPTVFKECKTAIRCIDIKCLKFLLCTFCFSKASLRQNGLFPTCQKTTAAIALCDRKICLKLEQQQEKMGELHRHATHQTKVECLVSSHTNSTVR